MSEKTLTPNKAMNVLSEGEKYYSVEKQKLFEIVRIDQNGTYLCCFKGSCTEAIHLYSGTTEEDFNARFDKDWLGAFGKHVLSVESQAKGLREYYEKSVSERQKTQGS